MNRTRKVCLRSEGFKEVVFYIYSTYEYIFTFTIVRQGIIRSFFYTKESKDLEDRYGIKISQSKKEIRVRIETFKFPEDTQR